MTLHRIPIFSLLATEEAECSPLHLQGKKGNTLILSTRVESAANTYYIEGELEIKLGNEDSFKYISYTIQDRG